MYNGFYADFDTTNLADNHRKLSIDQYAAFGELSYQLPRSLKATVGARYYSYRSSSVTSVSGVSANGTSAPLFGHASNSGVTPKLNQRKSTRLNSSHVPISHAVSCLTK